jgi:hypothetical protein
MGFTRLTATTSGTSTVSDFMARAQGISKFYINSVNLARQKTFNSFAQTTTGSTVLINNSNSVFMVIPIKVDIGDAIEYNEQNLGCFEYFYGNSAVLENIDISITDDYGLPLAVTDEWTLVLDATCIQD